VAVSIRPASCILETSENSEALNPEATRTIKEDMYVNDRTSGGDDKKLSRTVGSVTMNKVASLKYDGTLSAISRKAGFDAKMIVTSGETNSRTLDFMGGSVLDTLGTHLPTPSLMSPLSS
jgi:hypothetical protein